MQFLAVTDLHAVQRTANAGQFAHCDFLRLGIVVTDVQTPVNLAAGVLAVHNAEAQFKVKITLRLRCFHIRFVNDDVVPARRDCFHQLHRFDCCRIKVKLCQFTTPRGR